MTSSTNRIAGFSLVELMIVVAIVGILAAIGYPSYQNYARESKRTDARAGLERMAQLQERFFSDNNRYTSVASALGYGSNSPASPEGYWTLTVQAGDNATFTVRAAPGGSRGHVDPDCQTMDLDAAGRKISSPTSECW